MQALANKQFLMPDIVQFAELSRDRNPMHVDALYARRTQAQSPVVHGMYLLVWALEHAGDLPIESAQRVAVRFNDFVRCDETAVLYGADSPEEIRMEIRVDSNVRARFNLRKGEHGPGPVPPEATKLDYPAQPVNQDAHEIEEFEARLPIADIAVEAASFFPKAVARLGASRIAVLLATSAIVGMVRPGLHSIYAEAVFQFTEVSTEGADLYACLTGSEARYRLVRLRVIGPGIAGDLKAFVRMPPIAQTSLANLRALVRPGEFAGQRVLVVGGSRGLGELTAKIIAAGGGEVAITWARGEREANAVAAEIRAEEGAASVIRYDASLNAEDQLAALNLVPTHAYYFATPSIGISKAAVYSPVRLEAFLRIYVNGFWEIANALRKMNPAVSLYYPSTVFVDERPSGMTEYAMAKAAGEVLCADINAAWAPTRVTVQRVPRLLTDQTASIAQVEMPSAEQVLLPFIRATQSRGA